MHIISKPARTLFAILVVVAPCLIAGTAVAGQKIMIINGTRTAMVGLQLRESGGSDWQPDMLNRRPLGIQRQIGFERSPKCLYDIRAIFEDGHRVMKSRVDLCRSPRYLLQDF